MKKIFIILSVIVFSGASAVLFSGCKITEEGSMPTDPYKEDPKAFILEKSFTLPKKHFTDVECSIFKIEGHRYIHCNGSDSTTLLELQNNQPNN